MKAIDVMHPVSHLGGLSEIDQSAIVPVKHPLSAGAPVPLYVTTLLGFYLTNFKNVVLHSGHGNFV